MNRARGTIPSTLRQSFHFCFHFQHLPFLIISSIHYFIFKLSRLLSLLLLLFLHRHYQNSLATLKPGNSCNFNKARTRTSTYTYTHIHILYVHPFIHYTSLIHPIHLSIERRGQSIRPNQIGSCVCGRFCDLRGLTIPTVLRLPIRREVQA